MIKEENYNKKIVLIAQLVSVVLFVGLCILACFTAFYRTGTILISPLSAFLMSLFFIVFGVTFGMYLNCLFYGKRKLLSIFVPSMAAMSTTTAMYAGELVLMDGVLFQFGKGLLFHPIGSIPFAMADIFVILLSGVITYILITAMTLNANKAEEGSIK